MPQLSPDLDFECVCCVAHLLQSLILSLFVMYLCALELDSLASFQVQHCLCVVCSLLCRLLQKLQATSSELGRSCKLNTVH